MNKPVRASSQQMDIYLPADRRLALAVNTPLPQHTHGAALFADVSGFTVLTENMKRAYGARDGAERLAQYLNRVYDALIAEVDRYGGSVIGFSGDAVTCWFDDSFVYPLAERPEPGVKALGAASRRAVAGGLAMLEAMHQFEAIDVPGQGKFPLSIKIAIASGPVRRFLVGDPDYQYIEAAAGETMIRMAAAEHLAQRDQLVVDAATAAAIGSDMQSGGELIADNGEIFTLVCGLAPLPDPAPWPEIDAHLLDEEVAHPWLLPAVYERLERGRGEFLTELRPATALFTRFAGLDFERDPEAGEKLDRYIRWVQQVVRRYDGTLIQLTIGEKGSYYYVAFGAPRAHEDDPWRAASAALDMIHPDAGLDFITHVQIGISKGVMRTGAYGGKTRRTYGVLGDEVNLAARLMQNASDGQILVSETVQSALGTACVWQQLAPIRVKGKSEPVSVAALLGLAENGSEADEFQGSLVGRAAELEALVQAVAPVSVEDGGFAGIVVVDGEAGIGKSRLIHALRQRICAKPGEAVAGAGITWLECPADPILQQSLYPIRHFLRGYFNQEPEKPAEENALRFDVCLDGLLEDLPPNGAGLKAQLERTRSFLGALVGLHWPGSLYERLEPKLRFENTLSAVRALLLAESLRRPVALHIEDAHRLDPDTHALLEVIIRNARPFRLAILLSGRFCDEQDAHCLPAWGDPPVPPQCITLRELTPAHVAELGAQILNSLASGGAENGSITPLGAELAQFLVEKTNGNPLFIEELCKEIYDRRLAQVKHGGWSMAGDQGEEAPASLTALLVSRLDRLDAAVKETVQTAAVIGREFEAPVLLNMLALDEMSASSMEQARAELIWLPTGASRFIFRQSLMRDAAYNMQPHSRLQKLHTRAATMIETLYTADLAPHFADLAYHCEQGHDQPRAFYYARMAGALAASQYANLEAIHFYQMALRVAEELDAGGLARERLAVNAALGELLVTTGQHAAAGEHLSRAVEMANSLGEADAQARACRWMARLHENRGEYPEALATIQRGLEALAERETAETSELLNNAGLIYSRRGDYSNAQAYAERCQKIAGNIGSLAAQARAENLLGHIARLRGENTAAITHFEQSLSLYEQAADINGQALASNQLANALFGLGRWRDAEQRFSQARTFFEQIGDLYHRAFTDNNLGWIALNQGRVQDALEHYQQGLAALEQTGGSPYVMGAFHNNLGATYIRMGDAANANLHLQISEGYFEKAGARDWLPELHRHKASAALQVGDLRDAQAQVEQALSLAREFKMRAEEGNSLRVLGEIAAANNDVTTARQSFRLSLEVLAEVGDEYEHARSLLALARLETEQTEEMQAALKKAIPVLERLGAKQDLTEARRMLFRTLKETSK